MPFLGIILQFIAAGLLMALINWIGLKPWRRAAGAHWTERARLLWPVRITAGLNLFLLPIFLMLFHECWNQPSTPMLAVDGLAGFLGALAGCYPMEQEMFPGFNFWGWGRQKVVTWGIRFSLWIPFFAALIFMPSQAGWGLVLVAGGYLVFHLLVQWGLSRQFLCLIKFMKPAGPRLQTIVADTSARMNVKVRSTWQLGGMVANALARPITHELIFTDRLLEICSDDEVAAICAHELAHLTESKTVLAGRLLRSLSLFPLVFINPAMQYLGFDGVVLLYLAMLLVLTFTSRLPQRMEKRADAMALREQTNEGVYARALEKLYRWNHMPAVNARNKQTHPHLYDRMLAAGITPDYPRPARPRRLTWVGWLVVCGCPVLLLAGWIIAIAFDLLRINLAGQ